MLRHYGLSSFRGCSNNKNTSLWCNKRKAFSTVGSECKCIRRQTVFCLPAQYCPHLNHKPFFYFQRSLHAFAFSARGILRERSTTWAMTRKPYLRETWTTADMKVWHSHSMDMLNQLSLNSSTTSDQGHPLLLYSPTEKFFIEEMVNRIE